MDLFLIEADRSKKHFFRYFILPQDFPVSMDLKRGYTKFHQNRLIFRGPSNMHIFYKKNEIVTCGRKKQLVG